MFKLSYRTVRALRMRPDRMWGFWRICAPYARAEAEDEDGLPGLDSGIERSYCRVDRCWRRLARLPGRVELPVAGSLGHI